MPDSVSVTFQNLPVIGIDGRLRRGTAPGTFRIRVPHDSNLTAEAGELVMVSDAGPVTLRNCIPDLSTLRTEHHDGKREWSVLLRDRRATWPGKQVSARWNRRYRDNTIDPATEKEDSQIADEIMQDIGETASNTMYGTKPDIQWDDTPFSSAVDELTSLLPCHVCRNADDTYQIFQTDQGQGISDGWPNIIPNYLAAIESGPKIIRVKCAKTWFGAALQLRAVGMDVDGRYKPINDLSYRPSTGW